MTAPHTAPAPIRVYVVDDHEVVRRGVAALLESDPSIQVVGQAGTVADAIREIVELRPDVTVLDHDLPDGTGVDVCRHLRKAAPSVRNMIFTSYDDPATIEQAILAGAAGYVLKRIYGSALISGVRLVASGHSLIDPAVARRVVEQLAQEKVSAHALTELTPQQRRILFLIADGLTNRQISERLYLSEKTVKNHVTGVLARLGLRDRTQAALFAARLSEDRGAGASTSRSPMARSAA